MIILGIILLIIGFVASVPILWIIVLVNARPSVIGYGRTRGGRSTALLLTRQTSSARLWSV